MRPVATIVAPAIDFDQNTRAIMKEHIALQDDERNADAHERKSAGYRESATKRRLEIGRMLVEQKNSGRIKHGNWTAYVGSLGIEERNAQNWMQEFRDLDKSESNTNDSDSPKSSNQRERRAARKAASPRHRKDEQPDPPEADAKNDDDPDAEDRPSPALDIDRELSKLQNKICTFAESVPATARRLIAHELRETARLIEEMQ